MCGWRPRGEQDADLGQPPVEGGRSRARRRLEAVPERLGLDRVVEQQPVAEVAQLTARDGVDLGLVAEQATDGRGVERRDPRANDTKPGSGT